MDQSNDCLRRNDDCPYQVVDGEAIVVRLLPNGDSRVLSLNGVGTLVWELADGTLSLGEIGRHVAEAYEVTAERATHDVVSFAQDLIDRGLAFEVGERVAGG